MKEIIKQDHVPTREEVLAALGGIVTVPPQDIIDVETIKTLMEAYQEKMLTFKRSTGRYRGKLPKKGHVWYYIHYQIGNKLVYVGAYEMAIDFEEKLVAKHPVELYLITALSRELSNDEVVDNELNIKEYRKQLKILNQIEKQ